jgi:hypothetical protein
MLQKCQLLGQILSMWLRKLTVTLTESVTYEIRRNKFGRLVSFGAKTVAVLSDCRNIGRSRLCSLKQ